MKKAFFVVGAESSGTRMLTEAFISAGCYGDAGHEQRLDRERLDEAPGLVVFRRSLPHATKWPDLEKMKQRFTDAGYMVVMVQVKRNMDIMVQSQLRGEQHAKNKDQAIANILKANKTIRQYEHKTVHYESFVTDADVREEFFFNLGLPAPDMQFYDGNLKYQRTPGLKILWHSAPAFFHSGYATQTRGFVTRLIQAGHEVNIVSALSSQDLPGMTWQGIPHLPGGSMKHGVEGVLEWARRLKPDLVITLFDVWSFPTQLGLELKALGVDWMPIVPIDTDPVHPYTMAVLENASYPTAMSLFGLKQMKPLKKKKGVKKVQYLPHGVETKIFTPVENDKSAVGGKGKFVVGVVAANLESHDRKGLVPTFKAFAKFHKKHKNSVLYFHGELTRSEDGVDLEWLSHELGIKPHMIDRWVRWAMVDDHKMAELYNAFDVFMLLTRGEGFCIPLIEAQACGTPVIVTDYTAPQDLVGAGWKIPIVGKIPTLHRGYWAEPDVDAAVDALEEAYQMWSRKETVTDKARDFAMDYDFDVIVEKHLIPILKEIEDVRTKASVVVQPRTQPSSSKARKRKRRSRSLRKASSA